MVTIESPAKISVKVKIDHGESRARVFSTAVPAQPLVTPDNSTPLIGRNLSANGPVTCATLGGSLNPPENKKLKNSRNARKCSMCKTYDCDYPL